MMIIPAVVYMTRTSTVFDQGTKLLPIGTSKRDKWVMCISLNVPTTHICVEIYDMILTRNCGELLGLGHWCFISNDLT